MIQVFILALIQWLGGSRKGEGNVVKETKDDESMCIAMGLLRMPTLKGSVTET